MKVIFSPIQDTPDIQFVVICAHQNGQWLFVRNANRLTWEIPGGHIEKGESPEVAAARELQEETGALTYGLFPVCDYSVQNEGQISHGRLFVAQVNDRSDHLEHETAEVSAGATLPDLLTYPEIQPILWQKASEAFNI